jgi:N-glycosylase/DNA lyase
MTVVKLIRIRALDFDLAKTLDSGQVFHWEKVGNGFVGTIGDRAVYLEQPGGILKAAGSVDKIDRTTRSIFQATVRNYFALDHPLESICRSLPRDPAMTAAKEFCCGLRIIRQPKWECLAMFICSSMKQVAHIRQISLALRKRFGKAVAIDDEIVFTFPTAERLAQSSERELRECALGYRAKNLLATARLIANGTIDLERSATLSDVDLRKALCALPGVGAKVANCVMLFAYERLRAFPIDVWIERVLRESYFPRARKLNARRLQTFTEGYFGDHGGYAQQYLFHYARTHGKLEGRALSRPPNNGTVRAGLALRRSSLHDKGQRLA